mmetsp:Transcript_54328/g.117577  ORF Transcript_54328/g.117577 Transcript_54328/m.117577 type:complete len:540 (+) Transcript_54328:71-1690(+)
MAAKHTEGLRRATTEEPPRAKSSPGLPDLTTTWDDSDLNEKYMIWRNDYKAWRMGFATGARGEATVEGLRNTNDANFRYWFPDQAAFDFRKTISYWISIGMLEGSILFAFGAYFSMSPTRPEYSRLLVDRPYFIGSLFYTFSTYMLVFEMINLDVKKGEPKHYFLCSWSELRSKYHLELWSVGGALIYFVGALLYQIPSAAALVSERVPQEWRALVFSWPATLGAFCFVLGGVCECVHNRVLFTRPDRLVWWVSVFDMIGDSFFLLACNPRLSHHHADLSVLVGSLVFIAASTLSLLMWKSDQFGGTLLEQLNEAARSEPKLVSALQENGTFMKRLTSSVEPRTFSARSIFFLQVYALTAAVMIVNCCFYGGNGDDTNIRSFCLAVQQAFNLVVVSMVLILHSAGIQRLPKEQPYRLLMVLVRFVGIVTLLHTVLVFYVFLGEAENFPKTMNSFKSYFTFRFRRAEPVPQPPEMGLFRHRLPMHQIYFALLAIALLLLFVLLVGMLTTRRDRARRQAKLKKANVRSDLVAVLPQDTSTP